MAYQKYGFYFNMIITVWFHRLQDFQSLKHFYIQYLSFPPWIWSQRKMDTRWKQSVQKELLPLAMNQLPVLSKQADVTLASIQRRAGI